MKENSVETDHIFLCFLFEITYGILQSQAKKYMCIQGAYQVICRLKNTCCLERVIFGCGCLCYWISIHRFLWMVKKFFHIFVTSLLLDKLRIHYNKKNICLLNADNHIYTLQLQPLIPVATRSPNLTVKVAIFSFLCSKVLKRRQITARQ